MNAGDSRMYGKVDPRRRVLDRVLWTALWACTTTGCTLLRQPPAPAPAAPDCSQPLQEIARLQQALIDKDAEIGQLRAQQNVQAKELRQTTGEVARAEVKLRRLATEAGAASQLAEAEVALQSLTKSPPNGATAQRLQAQQLVAAGSAAFAQGDYGAAVEFAAQAQALVGMVKETQAASSARANGSRVPDCRCSADARRQPSARAAGTLRGDRRRAEARHAGLRARLPRRLVARTRRGQPRGLGVRRAVGGCTTLRGEMTPHRDGCSRRSAILMMTGCNLRRAVYAVPAIAFRLV